MADRPVITNKDQFAEYLSRGLDIPTIRARMGIPNGTAQRIMGDIRKDLGVPVRD